MSNYDNRYWEDSSSELSTTDSSDSQLIPSFLPMLYPDPYLIYIKPNLFLEEQLKTINLENYFNNFNLFIGGMNKNIDDTVNEYKRLGSSVRDLDSVEPLDIVKMDNWDFPLNEKLVTTIKGYNEIMDEYNKLFLDFVHNDKLDELYNNFVLARDKVREELG